MTFTGEYQAKLNSKNQVTLPSNLRESIFADSASLPLYFFDRFSPEEQPEECFLELVPLNEWKLRQQQVESFARLQKKPWMNRELNRRSEAVSLDPKGNGRIVIPSRFFYHFEKEGELMFVGNTRKIEIWDLKKYRNFYGTGTDHEKEFSDHLDQILEY